MRKFRIGGTLKSGLIGGLIKAIMQDGAFADKDDTNPIQLKGVGMNAIVPILSGGRITVWHGIALSYTEEFCVQKQLSFDLVELNDDPTACKARYYRPKKSIDVMGSCDTQGNPVMDYTTIATMLAELRTLSTKSAISGRSLAKILDDNTSTMAEELPKITVRG